MIAPLFYTDFYKTDHRRQYPAGTEYVYSNLTARYSRLPDIDYAVVFGIQAFVREYLGSRFDRGFFLRDKASVLAEYAAVMPPGFDLSHISDLHDLDYLPVHIKALPEGTRCPLRVPMLTIVNTHPKFFWVTNFLETLISNALWHPMTSATIASQYRALLHEYARFTSDTPEFVDWQGHDFSMRGQTSVESAIASAAGHLLSFTGTDTVPAIPWINHHYGGPLTAGSIPATEHSVMCMGGDATEEETFRRLLTEVYPSGPISIVSDTWDYWKVIGQTLPKLKDVVFNRPGKLVIRPDSGDPVSILCGDPAARSGTLEHKGTVRALGEIFGTTTNSKGYKVLHPNVGCIYGDSITFDRARRICETLARCGFASTNVVFGIGSYTYQYVTRDTLGFAMKATWGQINGKPVTLCKTPKTDDGVKYSARGLLSVSSIPGGLYLHEDCGPEWEKQGLLRTVFLDGEAHNTETFETIRNRLAGAK